MTDAKVVRGYIIAQASCCALMLAGMLFGPIDANGQSIISLVGMIGATVLTGAPLAVGALFLVIAPFFDDL
jgi:hypothetical protein